MRWKEKKPRQQTASGSRPGGSLGSFRKVACPLGAGPHLMAQGSDKFRGRRAPGCQVCRHIVSASCSSAALVALPFPGSRSPGSAAIPGTPGRQGDRPGDHSRWNGGLARAIMTGTRYLMDVTDRCCASPSINSHCHWSRYEAITVFPLYGTATYL